MSSSQKNLRDYVGNSGEFPILVGWDFFNHAAVAPIPAVGGAALRAFARQAMRTVYIDSGWYRDVETLRDSAAALIGAERSEIAFIKNTSEGIATVANGIDWQRGDRIVTTAVEYPANIYPWMDVAQRFGVELVMLGEETRGDGALYVPLEKILEAAAHPRTRLVALSHVEYASGQRHDIARIGKFCRESGKLFSVDAIQSLGVLPVDVKGMNIDFLSADGHKWLLGPEGAGIFYCRRELLPRIRPLIVGWMNVVNATDYANYDFTFRSEAAKFECGSWNIAGLLALKASLELLSALGIDRIAQRVQQITDHLIAGLRRKGYQIISPRGERPEWSGIVSFRSAAHDHQELVTKFRKKHRIELALRSGHLRCSPHFYNTEPQIDRLVDLLPGH